MIILSWNARGLLQNCIDSIVKTEYPLFEIIVSDNASTDGSVQFVRETYPQVKILENKVNLGYSNGNNVAIGYASGDLIVLLNQDTYVDKNWLKEIAPAAEDEKIGVIGTKILYPYTHTIQSIGFDIQQSGYPVPRMALQGNAPNIEKIVDVDFVAGTALAIKKSVLDKIGLLDSKYPAYFEDIDLCFRARKAGYRVVVAPNSLVYHFGSASFGKNSRRSIYFFEKSRIIFLKQTVGVNLMKIIWFDAKHTIDNLKDWLKGQALVQKEMMLSSNSGTSFQRKLNAILFYFWGKFSAYLSVLLD